MLFTHIEKGWQQFQAPVHHFKEWMLLSLRQQQPHLQARGFGASLTTTPTLTPTPIQPSGAVGSADATSGLFKF